MEEEWKIKPNVSMSPEQMDRLDKSKISYITMKDGDIYKIRDESKYIFSPQVTESKNSKTNLQIFVLTTHSIQIRIIYIASVLLFKDVMED